MPMLTTGCDVLYSFDRELPVPRGAIFGEAVRDSAGGEKAAYSQVNLMGVGLVRQATSDGAFVMTDLSAGTYILRINDDDDGDGQPDRSRLVATSLVVADKPDAFGFGSGQQLVSTSLGEVIVEGTGAVEGELTVDDGNGNQVPPNDLDLGGRVLLFRDVVTELTGEQALQLGADAETHVDAQGRYRFNKALSGEFLLVATLHRRSGAVRNETVFVSTPQRLTLGIDETVTAEDIEVDAIDANLEDNPRPLEIVVAPALSERGAPYAIFVPPGKAMSTCQSTRPGTGQFAYKRIVNATAAGISRLENAPQGVWDVRLCGEATFVDPETGNLEGEATLGSATLFSLVIPPSEDGVSTVLTGPVVLSRELDPCLRRVCPEGNSDCNDGDREFIRDCDGDGQRGIAPFDVADQDVVATWAACATQCGANTGLAAVEAECAFGGVSYDCDDDGDLQTDASEPPACYGPGLGDDRDGDGICTGDDGFPTCAANNATDCAAGTVDVDPTTPPEFEGGDIVIDDDPFDRNFGDNGIKLVNIPDPAARAEFLGRAIIDATRDFAFYRETRDGDPDEIIDILASVATTENAAGELEPVTLFENLDAEGVVVIPEIVASRLGRHYFIGEGYPTGFPDQTLPHICAASSEGEVIEADFSFDGIGCTNQLIAAFAPGGTNEMFRFENAIALESGACALGGAGPNGVGVQCYNGDGSLGVDALFDFFPVAESIGATQLDLFESTSIFLIPDGRIGFIALMTGNVDGADIQVSVYGKFDPVTGNVLNSGQIAADNTARVVSTIVSATAADPLNPNLRRMVGALVVEGENNPKEFFTMDLETVPEMVPVPASDVALPLPRALSDDLPQEMVAIADDTFAVVGGLTSGLEADGPPHAAVWRLSFADGPSLTTTEVGLEARGLEGNFSLAVRFIEKDEDAYIMGLKAPEDGGGNSNDVDLFFARLAPVQTTGTAGEGAPDTGSPQP